MARPSDRRGSVRFSLARSHAASRPRSRCDSQVVRIPRLVRIRIPLPPSRGCYTLTLTDLVRMSVPILLGVISQHLRMPFPATPLVLANHIRMLLPESAAPLSLQLRVLGVELAAPSDFALPPRLPCSASLALSTLTFRAPQDRPRAKSSAWQQDRGPPRRRRTRDRCVRSQRAARIARRCDRQDTANVHCRDLESQPKDRPGGP